MFAAAAIVAFAAGSAAAQQKVFKWSDELCDYQGTYNSRKFSATQLKDTAKLFSYKGLPLTKTPTVFHPDDLDRLDLEGLNKEYAAILSELGSLDIVPVPYWQEQRRLKIAELKQVYELSNVSIRGYTDPHVLNELSGSAACKTKFAAPLIAGGDTLINVWRNLNVERRENNADPASRRREFERELASADAIKFARVYVMAFGWWNCANENIKYIDYDGTQEREFRKLFVRVKTVKCDEP